MPTAELPDIKDAGIVVDFTHWGNPFHGYITGATLNLDGGGTHIIPATTTNDCFVFRVPGAPGGQGDAAPLNGEWRDYLLLYGKGQAVYESVVATTDVNWLFCRADGTRWLVSITSAVTGIEFSGASLAINFRAERFGHLVPLADAVPEYYDFTLTLSDRGLDDSTMPLVSAPAATASIGISDITPRGEKCCLMFYTETSGDENDNQRLPCGFFEVTMDDSSVTNFSTCGIATVYDISAVAGRRELAFYKLMPPDPLPSPPYCQTETTNNIVVDLPTDTSHGLYDGDVVEDAIIACWYIDGTLQPVKFNYSEPLTASSYTVDYYCTSNDGFLHGDEHDVVLDLYSNASSSIAYTAPVGGSYTMTATLAMHITGIDYVPTVPAGYWAETLSLNFSDGTDTLFGFSISNSFTDSDAPYNAIGTSNKKVTDVVETFRSFPEQNYKPLGISPNRMHPWALIETPILSVGVGTIPGHAPESLNAPLLFAKRFSSTLIGIGRTWIDHDSEERITVLDKWITKAGIYDPAYSIPNDTLLNNLSAAIHPVTLEIAIGSDGGWRSFV